MTDPMTKSTNPKLKFELNDFFRMSWVSQSAEAAWTSRVARINLMHSALEWMSVVSGLRSCGLKMLRYDEFDAAKALLHSEGLMVSVLAEVNGSSSYQSRLNQGSSDGVLSYWCAVGSRDNVKAITQAFESSNDDRIGELLGYPKCCREFFHEVWVRSSLIDSTWPSALNTDSATDKASSKITCRSSQCAVHLRWLGVRRVFHLPCSNDCGPSISIAESLMALGKEYGFDRELAWLIELSSMPAEWSALHGIAEVKTPLFKFVTNTDAFACKQVVHFEGSWYPDEGATGLAFPFHIKNDGLKRQHANGIEFASSRMSNGHKPIKEEDYRNNGFSSKYAMDRAHKPLVDACVRYLQNKNGGVVLDLGCGNGSLLREIARYRSDVYVIGVDCNSERIADAVSASERDFDYFCADIFDVHLLNQRVRKRVSVCILMLGRLDEVDSACSRELINWLTKNCDCVLGYAYTDYLDSDKSLLTISSSMGLSLSDFAETDFVVFGKVNLEGDHG